MKYTTEIIIDLPRDQVIEKLDSAENMKFWQRGLLHVEQISGKPGAVGAKMEMQYKMGKREITMVETIIKNDFPNEFHAMYDAKGVHNIQKNSFIELPDGKTKWISDCEFQFSGFMMKMIGFLMPGSFKKQSMVYVKDFKNFAEKGISVLD